jgi:lysophospholipase L1-like esterase
MRLLRGLSFAAAGSLAALAAIEVLLRVAGFGRTPRHEAYFEDSNRERIDYFQAKERGLVVTGDLPRNRAVYRPGLTFYMCYRGGRRSYMDARGCVEVRINTRGLREREELGFEKPSGQKRILCLGDSFTFGWGVPVELAWPRLVEGRLRQESGDDVRTVNCGAAGTLYVDEYWWGLRDRFGAYSPDVVLVSLCLNDVVLMPNTVALFSPAHSLDERRYPLLVLRYLAGAYNELHRLDLDPSERDWGQALMDIPPGDAWWAAKQETPDMFWKAGGPQAALRAMRGWCRERSVKLAVAVWPLFQGLEGDGSRYPFTTLHRAVVDFCGQESIPCLDLLPTFRGQQSRSLWVDPADMHGNEVAHALAAPAIAAFLAPWLRGG